MKLQLFIVFIAIDLIHFAFGQGNAIVCPADETQSLGCPSGWNAFQDNCYYFVTLPRQNKKGVQAACKEQGALPMRFTNEEEYKFIAGMLNEKTVNRSVRWYTAGIMNPTKFGQFLWESYNQDQEYPSKLNNLIADVPPDSNNKGTWNEERTALVLGSDGSVWRLYLLVPTEMLYYGCQAPKSSINSLVAAKRRPDFLQPDIRQLERGPCITKQPVDVLYLPTVISRKYVTFSCEFRGYPQPEVRWYIVRNVAAGTVRTLIKPLDFKSGKVSQTGGLLTIHEPDQSFAHKLECQVENAFGAVISQQAEVIQGRLEMYQSGERQIIRKASYSGFLLDCDAPAHAPEESLVYTFYTSRRSSTVGAIDEAIQANMRFNLFLSRNIGLIGFSVATPRDSGSYKCMITFKGLEDAGSSFKSPDMVLEVYQSNTVYPSPQVQDRFPNFRPSEPLRGQTVRMECFGYGEIKQNPLSYIWTWNGGKMPSKSIIQDYERVIEIPDVQVEDEGRYSCQIRSSDGRISDLKSTVMRVFAKPTFVNAPQNTYADAGGSATLACLGMGIPDVSSVWYRNTLPLIEWLSTQSPQTQSRFNYTNSTGKSTQSSLTITGLLTSDAAMFGCILSNKYGTNTAFVELKVFLQTPSFNKYPLLNTETMVGTSFMLPCRPEAAPDPEIEWRFNGGVLGLQTPTIDNGVVTCPAKYCRVANSTLMVSNVANSDRGTYACIARNSLGSAESSAFVEVVPPLAIGIKPLNRRVKVNTNVPLPCMAVASPYLDIDYDWYFENVRIQFDRLDLDARRFDASQFDRPYQRYFGPMTIKNIQFYDEGNYTCRIITPISRMDVTAFIKVIGPPGEVGAISISTDNNTFGVEWTNGDVHGKPITSYILEVVEDKFTQWLTLASFNHTEVKELSTIGVGVKRYRYEFTGLPANLAFRLRLTAINEFGPGNPSAPSSVFSTPARAPVIVPLNVTGGGGKMNSLVVRWEKLLKVQENGPDFTYHVRYKLTKDVEWNLATSLLIKNLDNTSSIDKYRQATITLSDRNFFKIYDVEVRAANSQGVSPWSTTVEIRSAPTLLQYAPKNVEAASHNSTAISVTWSAPVMKHEEGDIIGYHIIYWLKGFDCKVQQAQADRWRTSQRLTVYKNSRNEAIIIGLETDSYYCVGVQAINAAGDGPESSFFDQTTFKKAPQNFPTMVTLNSTGRANTVAVKFNGVRVNADEESVDGYMIRYWLSGGPVRMALDVDCGMKTHGVVSGLKYGVRYNLRVMGYSRGGHGQLSHPMNQFMLVPRQQCYKDRIIDGPDVRYYFLCGSCNVLVSSFLLIVSLLVTRIVI